MQELETAHDGVMQEHKTAHDNPLLLFLQPDYLKKTLTLKTDLILLKTQVNKINVNHIHMGIYAVYLTAF